MVVQGSSTHSGPGAEFGAARLIDDDPCLACFQNDFTASATPLFLLAESFRPLSRVPSPPDRTPQDPIAGFPASRSPPDSA